jgi:hypothetical protein
VIAIFRCETCGCVVCSFPFTCPKCGNHFCETHREDLLNCDHVKYVDPDAKPEAPVERPCDECGGELADGEDGTCQECLDELESEYE